MTSAQRMRRELVRAAVQENLDLIQGLRPRQHRRPQRASWGRLALYSLAPALLLGVLLVRSGAGGRLNAALGLEGTATSDPALAVESGVAAGGVGSAGSPASPGTAAAGTLPILTVPAIPGGVLAPIAPSVLPLAVRTIVLDPGHGGAHHGTEAPGGLIEKDLTLDISERLRTRLEAARYRVLMTRAGDATVALQDRAAAANAGAGDLFVSVHLNWIAARQRGVETYYLGPTDDPFITRLAAAENHDSGYSYADSRRLLDGIYADLRREESRRLAEAVQRHLFAALLEVNPAVRDRGVKTAPFLVLVATGMPAILAEVSCLSDAEEVQLLRDPSYRQRIADALYAGIAEYAGGPAATKGSDA